MGLFAMVGTVMGTGGASMPACRCAFVSVCQSVCRSRSLPQNRRMDQTWKNWVSHK